MTGLLFLALLALGGFVVVLVQRMGQIERRVRDLDLRLARAEDRAVTPPPAQPQPSSVSMASPAPPPPTLSRPAPVPAHPASPPPPEPTFAETLSNPFERLPSLETIIGGKLPVWVGGAALVLAGFFLVRYSIESGLLGPGVRTVMAALFAAILIAGAEVARRHRLTRDDPRIAQVLAGAGVASAYGTLYIAAALFDLIAPLPAFILMVLITAGALALALRHGPPTAVMALIGGFVAPLVAGFDAAGIGPLLVYLGLFVAALFGLAIRRGWTWLALAACGAGFGWASLLLILTDAARLSGVGVFVVLLAIGATLALPATGKLRGWVRVAPLVAGLVQLIAFAPALDFGPLAWGFYLVLSAACLIMAWRNPLFLTGVAAALFFLIALLITGLGHPVPGFSYWAGVIAIPLFAAPALWRSRDDRIWAGIALGALTAPVLILHVMVPERLTDSGWAAAEIALAAVAALLVWRHRDRAGTGDPGLIGGAAVAALLAVVALAQFSHIDWIALPLPLALAMGGLAATGRATHEPRVTHLAIIPFLASLGFAYAPIAQYLEMLVESFAGTALTYPLLPTPGDAMRGLLLPVATALGILALAPSAFGRQHKPMVIAVATLAILLAYTLAKQALAIASPERFMTLGFAERAILTQIAFLSGWLLIRDKRLPNIGEALLLLGLARVVWFDLLLLNPAFAMQSVGGVPLANAATVHAALAALCFWTLPATRRARVIAILLTIVAVAASVRQVAHGSILTGPLGSGENWGYSAALLGLAIVWLWRGITGHVHDLRIAGLSLLTVVTFKVFLIDVSALAGILRILSILALGIALIAIGWAYRRFLAGTGPVASP